VGNMPAMGPRSFFGLLEASGTPAGRFPLESLLGVAGLIELCGGLLITVAGGGLGRIPGDGEMATAYFLQHAPCASGHSK